jgi:hypothetical protein
VIDRELKPQQSEDRPMTRAEAARLEDAVQEQALTAWRIMQERKRAERLARWLRWARR